MNFICLTVKQMHHQVQLHEIKRGEFCRSGWHYLIGVLLLTEDTSVAIRLKLVFVRSAYK